MCVQLAKLRASIEHLDGQIGTVTEDVEAVVRVSDPAAVAARGEVERLDAQLRASLNEESDLGVTSLMSALRLPLCCAVLCCELYTRIPSSISSPACAHPLPRYAPPPQLRMDALQSQQVHLSSCERRLGALQAQAAMTSQRLSTREDAAGVGLTGEQARAVLEHIFMTLPATVVDVHGSQHTHTPPQALSMLRCRRLC